MQYDEVVRERHSTRAYVKHDIPESHLTKIIGAANRAPSAGNIQAYRIFVATSASKKKEVAECAFGQHFITEASACLVFSSDPEASASEYGMRGRELYSIQDATIAATFAILKSVDLGYQTAWIGSFDTRKLAEVTGSKDLVPVAIILIGKASEKPLETTRKGIDEISSFLD